MRGVEDPKIECARKFFASMNEKNGEDVMYDVVQDYSESTSEFSRSESSLTVLTSSRT